MSAVPGWYADPSSPARLRWWDGTAWTAHVTPSAEVPVIDAASAGLDPSSAVGTPTTDAASRPVGDLKDQVVALARERDALQAQIVTMRGMLALEEVGLYQYAHPLESATAYEDALKALEEQMRVAIKAGDAVAGTTKWAINGSEKDGARMVADFCKLMLRAYNAEAESLVRMLKPHSLKVAVERLQRLRASIAKLGLSMKIHITDTYHALRVRELELTADYLSRVAEEKEREREERARLKEEEAARREYEREQARLEKERAHYESVLNALRMKGDESAVREAELKVGEIQSAIAGVVSRAANVRAGYVYVISNIGSFGDAVVKIGMTRRLDPLERVRELGDASVPFRFDVHAIIFSDDAVGLEAALHQRFAEGRVNCVNLRREFFSTTPHRIKEALLEMRHELLTFVETPEALEWHQSQNTLRARGGVGGSEPPAGAPAPWVAG